MPEKILQFKKAGKLKSDFKMKNTITRIGDGMKMFQKYQEHLKLPIFGQ
jgi:hypothetical protein